jgi:glycosyltransferase involved in cell wall biosynthesis
MNDLRVLISAFACHPPTSIEFPDEEKILGSGESLLGWNIVKQINRFHKVCVITQKRNKKGIERAIKQGEIRDINFYYLDLPLWPRFMWNNQITLHIYYYIWQIMALFLAKKLHKEFKFDIAHHITYANYWMPSFIGAFLPVSFIWGPLGGGQRIPNSFFKQFSLKGKISERIRDIAQWIGRNVLISRKLCLIKTKAILVCNYETRAKTPEKHLHKVHFFPVNGISKEGLIKAFKKSIPHEKFLIITAGRLLRLKGFDIAINAVNLFLKKFQNATLEIVGEGPEKTELQELTQSLRITDKINFTSWLPHKELLARMRESDVFLFPSFRDGGGAVVVEAMASGIPVICLDTGGPGFHIQDEWGIKIEPKNPEYVIDEMAKALERLYLDKDLRLRLGQAARKRAEEFYLWDRLGDRMQEIYEEALKQISN